MQNATKHRIGLILALAYLVATLPGASCQPTPPNPPGPTGGMQPDPVVVGGSGGESGAPSGGSSPAPTTLPERACANAYALCGVDTAECLRQVNQLRSSSYATITDADLQCWVDAKDRTALAKCPNGVCR